SDIAYRARLGPSVFGLKRKPARRSSGCAKSAIDGNPAYCSISIQRFCPCTAGDNTTVGVGSTSTILMMACGGFWYVRLVCARAGGHSTGAVTSRLKTAKRTILALGMAHPHSL